MNQVKDPAPRAATSEASDPIEHIFHLMMENRSFDHFLGAIPGVDGINAASPRSNDERPGSSKSYAQEPGAARKMKPDPHHETKNTIRQINGGSLGSMGGFVHDFVTEEPKSSVAARQEVMRYFADGTLPALHRLAKEFCVCDQWFSSVPGPTWTNRFFAHSGTSQGWVDMPHFPFLRKLHKYDQTTVYDRLNERGVKWRIYAGDIPQSLVMYNLRKKENRRNYSKMSHFYRDLQNATTGDGLPSYVFIEPTYLITGQNDQHPPHDVLKGDELIASVYNAIRANEAVWKKSLLIITWDEHGGFYDHVRPPMATPPDDKRHEYTFDEYGVRVPAVLVSPWVTRGSVFRAEQRVLDHTSVLRYLTDKFKLGPLGNRTAVAASFASAITTNWNAESPSRVGTDPRPLEGQSVIDPGPITLNRNQAALVDFTRQLEVEMGASPAAIGMRSIQAASGIEGEMAAARERVRLFIEQAK